MWNKKVFIAFCTAVHFLACLHFLTNFNCQNVVRMSLCVLSKNVLSNFFYGARPPSMYHWLRVFVKVVREIYLFKCNEETGYLRKLCNDVHNLYLLTDITPVTHEGEQMGRACRMCGSVQPLDVTEGTWVLCITYFVIHFMVSGNHYYLYNGNQLERGFPKPLTNLGLPESLEKIDGAMVWGHNGKTYFFSGTMYWK